jgi:hypothetical protein
VALEWALVAVRTAGSRQDQALSVGAADGWRALAPSVESSPLLFTVLLPPDHE